MHGGNPGVSVILPTYNGSSYIGEAIRACLDQTYTNWELIVVDDGSTDDTLARVAKYDDARIIVVRHKINRRLPGALNTGFARGRGRYLTWTSDDNLYRPEALERMVAFLEGHGDIDIVHADFSVTNAVGKVIERRRVSDREGLMKGECIGPCFLYRRHVQEGVGWYASDLFLAEDYDFWLRASARFRFAELHEDLYFYRRHRASLTSRYGYGRIAETIHKALQKNLPDLDWVSPAMKRYHLSRSWVRVGHAHYIDLQLMAALKAWREALRLDISILTPRLAFLMAKSLCGSWVLGRARSAKRAFGIRAT
jgi:glycosyltransferase involved in cell wall biosynthesis